MRITLFASTPLALPLIHHLYTQNRVVCVMIANQQSPESQMLLQNVAHFQMPYAFFDPQNAHSSLEILKQTNTNLAIVFTFGYKLSIDIINFFDKEIYNIHASPLPHYRGSQPLFWQLRNGENQSALTLHQLNQTLDSGDIILQKPFEIHPKDTYGILNGMVSQMAVALIQEFLEHYPHHSASPQKGELSYAPKVEQKDITINWNTMNAQDIVNLVRACNPSFGGAQMQWKGAIIALLEATAVDSRNFGLPAGTIIHIGLPEGLIAATLDGAIRLDVVAMPDGYFSGVNFATRFGLDAGERLG